MFGCEDFQNINYINFDESFNINLDGKSKIIFGYNGIGKSSIYKYLKKKYLECDFLDYEDTKESFLKSKTEVVIGAKIYTITQLEDEIDKLKQSNKVEEILKKYDYTSAAKARKVSGELAKIQKDKEIKSISTESSKFEIASRILYEDIRKDFFDNYSEIKKISNIFEELENLKNVYMTNAYSALINSLEDDETTCPACSTTGIHNLKENFKKKMKIYEESKKSCFGNFHFRDNSDKEVEISAMVELAQNLNEKEIAELIICDVDVAQRDKIIENLNKIAEKNEKIIELEQKLERYYNNIKREENDIKAYFENRFDIANIEFKDDEKKIIITFNRKVDTYSEGEIHLIILLFKLYEFKINDKDKLIIDDPLTSYDLINQYKTLFEIVNTVNNNKKILIFTHNIEMINIINTQNSRAFQYHYIEKYLGKLFIKEIDIRSADVVLKLSNLLMYDEDKYLKLLIERENGKNEEYHKIFHYDAPYILNDEEYNGLTNEYFADMIQDFKIENIQNCDFSKNSFRKIIYMCGLRVWIEKKFFEALRDNTMLLNLISGKTFGEKINILLPMNQESLLHSSYPNITRTFLMSKKVMLNQNEHYQSQIIPFNYALNISLDDLINEIIEIKSKFEG